MKKEKDNVNNIDVELNESDNSSIIEKKIEAWKPEHNIILSEFINNWSPDKSFEFG